MSLTLEIVTPTGVALAETELDSVVVRRREDRFDPGSEIVILKSHGPLLVSSAACVVRFRAGGRIGAVRVGRGVAEVLRDRVTVLAREAEVL
ncbi:MAG: hypothetical protein FDZ70_10780 [Actinobacteria bacterium]|nr:MAG: hypothetical protein FDZ70_10780 [Actinomycetota bacterium]